MAENSHAKQRHHCAVDNTPGSAPSVPWISLSQWPEPAVSPDLSHLQMLQARQRKQQAACRRAATEPASLEAVPAVPRCQEMVLFVLAQDSQNYFTGSQLPSSGTLTILSATKIHPHKSHWQTWTATPRESFGDSFAQ